MTYLRGEMHISRVNGRLGYQTIEVCSSLPHFGSISLNSSFFSVCSKFVHQLMDK